MLCVSQFHYSAFGFHFSLREPGVLRVPCQAIRTGNGGEMASVNDDWGRVATSYLPATIPWRKAYGRGMYMYNIRVQGIRDIRGISMHSMRTHKNGIKRDYT